MKQFQPSFHFPKQEDLHLLKGIQTVQELKKFFRNLKRSTQYDPYHISYSTRQCQRNKQYLTKHFSLYFNCCQGRDYSKRPSIHFISCDGESYKLEEKSTFEHFHLKGRKRKPYRDRELKINKKKDSLKRYMSQSEKSWKQDDNEIIHQKPFIKFQLSDEPQSSEKSDSWEEMQRMEKRVLKPLHKHSRVFDFPTINLLQKIGTITSISAINSRLSHFIRLKCYEQMQIRHHGKIYTGQTEDGQIINFLLIEFQCCKKSTTQRPYLRFIQKESGVFQLKDYHLRHDHRDGRGRKKNFGVKKQGNQIKIQTQKQTLQKNIMAVKTNILDIILKDHQLMKMSPQKKTQNFIQHEQKQIKMQPYKFQKNIILKDNDNGKMDDEEHEKKVGGIEKEDFFYQNSIPKNHLPAIKTKSQDDSLKIINSFPIFQKKQKKNEKIIIEISSQSQQDFEIKNQNKKQKTITKKAQSSQKYSFTISKKKRRNKNFLKPQQNNRYNEDEKSNQSKTNSNCEPFPKTLKKVTIYAWLQKYNDQVSKFISLKQSHRKYLKETFQQQMQRLFKDYFGTSWKYLREQTQQNLNQCVERMMLWNKFQIMQLSNLKMNKSKINPFFLENKIVLKKIKDRKKTFQSQKRDIISQNVQIFLAVYPIQIKKRFEKLKVFIAYTLTYQLYPNILCFYVFGKNSKNMLMQNFTNEDFQRIIYYQVLCQAIKYYGFKKINFIYTTLDCQLMDALDKICKNIPSQKFNIETTMHFSCIHSLFQIEVIPQNFQLINGKDNQIKGSGNQSTIAQTSRQILKNIITKNHSFQRHQSEKINNPRVIYQHYRTFVQPLLSQNSQRERNFSTAGLTVFQSELLYNKKEKVLIQSPVSQLNSIMTQYNKFNHISQLFILFIRHSDFTSRKTVKLSNKTQIVPFQLVEVQNQCKIFNSLHGLDQKLYYSIEKIFAEPAFDMPQILSKCPRFIIQTIYRLIIAANQLALKKQKKSQRLDENLYIYQDIIQSQKSFLVIPVDCNGNLRQFIDENIEQVQELGNKWKCSCNFYQQTGIPCEHVILTVLENKESLFNEIHSSWKNKYL